MNTVTFKVEGMTCPACEDNVRSAVMNVPGVSKVLPSAEEKFVKIEYDGGDEHALAEAIMNAGYKIAGKA